MVDIVRYDGANGEFMLVETRLAPSDVQLVADESSFTRVSTQLENSLGSIRGASVALLSVLQTMERQPEEATIELELAFGVEGGVLVAKGSAHAQATVTLKWKSARADQTES